MDTVLKTFIGLSAAAVLCLAGCGTATSAGGQADPTEADLADAGWRAITNNARVLAGIKFDGASGELIVINNREAAIDAPGLTTYELATGEATSIELGGAKAIAPGGSLSVSFTYPGGNPPGDDALIALSLGSDAAALFLVSAEYSKLSPAALTAKTWPYPAPNPGTWNFEMHVGSEYLSGTNCPSGSSDTTTTGECELYLTTDELSAMWFIDGEYVTLNRTSSLDDFDSPTYMFTVGDSGVGTNKWTLTPASQTSIAGALRWDNNLGCSAEYPIEMNFESLSTPSVYALCEGPWSISYSVMGCGSAVVSSATLPLLPSGTYELDVTYALGDPLSLSFGPLTGAEALPNLGGSNIFGVGMPPNMPLGTATDALGNILTIYGGFQMIATSTTTITGIVNLMGFGLIPCTGSAIFTMTSLSGC